jgi:hypothetical protein
MRVWLEARGSAEWNVKYNSIYHERCNAGGRNMQMGGLRYSTRF